MSHYIKIANTELVRDLDTKAVLNTDRQALEEFERNRRKILSDRKNSQETKQRLEQLEKDMNDIKTMLMELKSMKDHRP